MSIENKIQKNTLENSNTDRNQHSIKPIFFLYFQNKIQKTVLKKKSETITIIHVDF